jgi:hypothetical protein
MSGNNRAATPLAQGKMTQPEIFDQKKLLNQAFDRLHREVESNRESFLRLKKDYDRFTVNENLFQLTS